MRLADPIVGLLITFGILFILKGAARDIYHRLMDAVDPELVDEIARLLEAVPGVREVGDVRVRWIGHALRAEVQVEVDGSLNVAAGHAIALDAHHVLLHEVHRLTSAIVHIDPHSQTGRGIMLR